MKKVLFLMLALILAMGLGAGVAFASPGIWETNAGTEVSVTDDTITLGIANRLEADTTQLEAVHGATIELPPAEQIYVEFSYDLSTWDSYNPQTVGGTGYWDLFSISVSQDKYWNLSLTDPLNGDPLDIGFQYGGTKYGDGILEGISGSGSATMTASTTSTNYLNVVLDTATLPHHNGSYGSWGEILITKIEITGVPEVTKELVDAWEEPVGEPNGIIDLGEKWYFVLEIIVTNPSPVTVTDVIVKDNFGGDLELIDWDESTGDLAYWTTGKTEKVHLVWTVGDLAPAQSETLLLLISTDMNTGHGNGKNLKFPDGHQEYTSEGEHCLNSGATAKGFVELASGVWEVSDTTDEICVETGQAPMGPP